MKNATPSRTVVNRPVSLGDVSDRTERATAPAAAPAPATARTAGQQVIIDAARREFGERGYDAVPVRDIAARAGVSLSALYHYYPGKQALLEGIVEAGLRSYDTACAAALGAAGDDPARRLAALVAATVRYRAQQQVDSSIVFSETRSVSEEFRARHSRQLREATGRFQRAIADGIEAGIFNPRWPDDARRAVIAMCNAVAEWYRPGGELTVDDLVTRYVNLAFTLVEYRPTAPPFSF